MFIYREAYYLERLEPNAGRAQVRRLEGQLRRKYNRPRSSSRSSATARSARWKSASARAACRFSNLARNYSIDDWPRRRLTAYFPMQRNPASQVRMAGPRAHIDLDAIVDNWRMFSRRAAPGKAAAVVKADAYGLGAAKIAPALARAGCTRFYVAWPQEGVELRKAIGAGAEIAVFHGPAERHGRGVHRLQARAGAQFAGADRDLALGGRTCSAPIRCTSTRA